MSDLAEKIVRRIAATGPISVADYMATCLFDPEHGYYTTREPFGRAGDFVTAPEISQMFGELVGIWIAESWQRLGAPLPFRLTEIGPGRGTLMKDICRVLSGVSPRLFDSLDIVMVEASPRLADRQRETLGDPASRIRWQGELDDTPHAGVVVANELFDAIPVRQFVKTDAGWRERVVALDEAGALQFAIGPTGIDPGMLPADHASAAPGAIFEAAPAREAMMERIAASLKGVPGAALLIDYGHERSGFGDTLQAMRDHAFADPLVGAGIADLTSHVDFEPLARIAASHDHATRFLTQGDFLIGMGLLERAGQLGANADEARRKRLAGEVERLAAPNQMGNLFKVLMLHPRGTELPPEAHAD